MDELYVIYPSETNEFTVNLPSCYPVFHEILVLSIGKGISLPKSFAHAEYSRH